MSHAMLPSFLASACTMSCIWSGISLRTSMGISHHFGEGYNTQNKIRKFWLKSMRYAMITTTTCKLASYSMFPLYKEQGEAPKPHVVSFLVQIFYNQCTHHFVTLYSKPPKLTFKNTAKPQETMMMISALLGFFPRH